MKTVVFGKTIESANAKMNSLLKEIPEEEIGWVRKTHFNSSISMKNGDIISVLIVDSCYCCGSRFNVAYVDREISLYNFYVLILPGAYGDFEIIFYKAEE
jgi:hypothetical protein